MLLAFSNPKEGAEDEFNTWYDNVHLKEIGDIPGVVSGRRYRLVGPEGSSPCRYLAVYETDGDPNEVLAALGQRMAAGEITMTDALDMSGGSLQMWQAI